MTARTCVSCVFVGILVPVAPSTAQPVPGTCDDVAMVEACLTGDFPWPPEPWPSQVAACEAAYRGWTWAPVWCKERAPGWVAETIAEYDVLVDGEADVVFPCNLYVGQCLTLNEFMPNLDVCLATMAVCDGADEPDPVCRHACDRAVRRHFQDCKMAANEGWRAQSAETSADRVALVTLRAMAVDFCRARFEGERAACLNPPSLPGFGECAD